FPARPPDVPSSTSGGQSAAGFETGGERPPQRERRVPPRAPGGSAGRPADAVRLSAAPLGEGGPLVGPAVVERVGGDGTAGVLARCPPGFPDVARARGGS